MSAHYDLSIVIPAYNEERRISATLAGLDAFARRSGLSCEVCVVLDGCTDGTAAVVRAFLEGDPAADFLLIELPANAGKGAAVKHGVMQAHGKVVAFTDADLPYALDRVPEVLDLFRREPGLQLVVGARDLDASQQSAPVPLRRRFLGGAYSVLVRSVLNTRIADTQCGFKFFRGDTVRRLFERVTIPGFGFDVEVIHIARVNRWRIERVPVHLLNMDGSSMRLVRDSTRMFWELLLIRLRDLRRFYALDLERDQIPAEYQHRALHEGRRAQRTWHGNRLRMLAHVLRAHKVAGRGIDAGCGSGIALPELVKVSPLVVALDNNPACLTFVKAVYGAAGCSPVAGAVQLLPLRDAALDWATLLEVIEHHTPEDGQRTIEELRRVLKPGGLLFLTTPNRRSAWPLVEYLLDSLGLTPRMGGDQHLSSFDRRSLRALLENHGYEVITLGAFNFVSPWLGILSQGLAGAVFQVEQRLTWLPGALLFCLARKRAQGT
ncbi:MAG: glycosyltransferase [Candidatus Hydrogenedentes bacterium]|nr:glycosyltransferase [Candidatus Hydrogenedentota bacterium]